MALSKGRSLLAAGVVEMTGEFSKGDPVSIVRETGEEVARGLIAYDSADATKIMGLKSADIETVLGYHNGAALVHRDMISEASHLRRLGVDACSKFVNRLYA